MEVSVMPRRQMKRKPEAPGARLSYNVNVRLNAAEYGVLVLVGEQYDIGLSAALRHVIDQWALGFTNDRGETLLDAAAEAAAPGPKWAALVASGALPAPEDPDA
jgi:hypothetical protein